MPRKKSDRPEWILDNCYGIGRDQYNWILRYRSPESTRDYWSYIGYWPTLEALLQGYYQHALVTATPEADLLQHVQKVTETATEAINNLTLSPAKGRTGKSTAASVRGVSGAASSGSAR